MSAGLADIKLYILKRRFSSMLKYLRYEDARLCSLADNDHRSEDIEVHVFVMELQEMILEEG
jgi:hypothetical protein